MRIKSYYELSQQDVKSLSEDIDVVAFSGYRILDIIENESIILLLERDGMIQEFEVLWNYEDYEKKKMYLVFTDKKNENNKKRIYVAACDISFRGCSLESIIDSDRFEIMLL